MSIPRPKTRLFDAFTTNINYARGLVKAGQSLADLEVTSFDTGDLYRAAWVQAVSALDHWLHEEIFARVAELADNTGPGMPTALRNVQLPLSVVEQVRLDNLRLRDAVVDQVKGKWATQSLQNPKEISSALKLVCDDDVWSLVARQMNSWNNYAPPTWSRDAVSKRLSAVNRRRNEIAHAADLDPTTGRRRPISYQDATDAVAWIDSIALAIAMVL
ncbi:hypothetical protein [Nocardia nepalensis]|uniref:hypothetical protein n=1 Tax=Nocardia nepalensis TaxID=3375448 RepID=UPI003B681388